MNTANNRRRRDSILRIQNAFVDLLQSTPLQRIRVGDICKLANINRSTFYSNYLDIYDLSDKLRAQMESDFAQLFEGFDGTHCRFGALRLFTHIKENQKFYNTYFQLCYDEKHMITLYDHDRATMDFDNKNIPYHIEFFRNGLNAIIKLWLRNGCRESPEEMAEILKQEYRGR